MATKGPAKRAQLAACDTLVQPGAHVNISAPHTVFWGGEHAIIAGAPAVLQHISRRIHVDVRRTDDSGLRVSLLPIEHIDRLPWSIETREMQELEDLLGAACGYFDLSTGAEFTAKSEGIPSGGANASGALCSVLAAGLLWANGRLNPADIEAIGSITPSALAAAFNEKSFLCPKPKGASSRRSTADRLVRFRLADTLSTLSVAEKAAALLFLAWCLECHFHGGKASGYGAFAPMIHCHVPFVFFPQPRSDTRDAVFVPGGNVTVGREDWGPFDLRRHPNRADENLDELNKLELREVMPRLVNNLAALKIGAWNLATEPPETPGFCFGVVYTGRQKDTGRQIGRTMDMPKERDEAVTRMTSYADSQRVVEPRYQGFRALKMGQLPIAVLTDPRQWELHGLAVELHEGMRELLSGRHDDISNVARLLRRIHSALESWGLDWYEGRVVGQAMYEALGCDNYPQSAVKLTGGGGGGSLLFLAPKGSERRLRSRLEAGDLPVRGVVLLECLDDRWPDGRGLSCEQRDAPRRRPRPFTVAVLDTAHTSNASSGVDGNADSRQLLLGAQHGLAPMIVAESDAMKKVLRQAEECARTDCRVLLQGETGTGKDVVARLIHDLSKRHEKPLVTINCARYGENLAESALFGHEKGTFTGATHRHRGVFEQADKSTLFLDEIASLKLGLQGMLLRVLENKTLRRMGGSEDIAFDVRVVAACCEPLQELMQQKRFRRDLYYRLAVAVICIPPLRSRKEDIVPLAEHFLRTKVGESGGFTKTLDQSAKDVLAAYDWPGNVREVENAMENAIMRSKDELVIGAEHLPKFDLSPDHSEPPRPGRERLRAYLGDVEIRDDSRRWIVARAVLGLYDNGQMVFRPIDVKKSIIGRLIHKTRTFARDSCREQAKRLEKMPRADHPINKILGELAEAELLEREGDRRWRFPAKWSRAIDHGADEIVGDA